MTTEIIVAIITGSVTLLGVLISNSRHDAVIDTKIDQLTEEVRKHNNFAVKIPVIQTQIEDATRRITAIEHKVL
jgi:uncharacterized membrane-anchored protein YjiN (DUF445 family)